MQTARSGIFVRAVYIGVGVGDGHDFGDRIVRSSVHVSPVSHGAGVVASAVDISRFRGTRIVEAPVHVSAVSRGTRVIPGTSVTAIGAVIFRRQLRDGETHVRRRRGQERGHERDQHEILLGTGTHGRR